MNREIKFRAWDVGKQEMAYNIEAGYDVGTQITFYYILKKTDHFKVMQFTGLKDKNGKGKEIYDGDIMSAWRSAPWDNEVPILVKGIVTFSDPFPGCFCVKDAGENTSYLHDWIDGEVIGNIYENPELLK
jgi:uncharacterized phage protein (TIGR01671 family)